MGGESGSDPCRGSLLGPVTRDGVKVSGGHRCLWQGFLGGAGEGTGDGVWRVEGSFSGRERWAREPFCACLCYWPEELDGMLGAVGAAEESGPGGKRLNVHAWSHHAGQS